MTRARCSSFDRMFWLWISWTAWHCSAKECAQPEESVLLQTLSAAGSGRLVASMNNFSLDTVFNSTLKDVDKMRHVFWAERLGRSSRYILESAGLRQTAGVGAEISISSSWPQHLARLAGSVMVLFLEGFCLCKAAQRSPQCVCVMLHSWLVWLPHKCTCSQVPYWQQVPYPWQTLYGWCRTSPTKPQAPLISAFSDCCIPTRETDNSGTVVL